METKPRSLFMNAVIYGLIFAASSIVISILTYVLDINALMFPMSIIIIVITLFLLVLFMVMATKGYRDKIAGGKLPFGQRFVSTLVVGLVGLIITSVFSYLFVGIFDPDTFQHNFMELIDWMESKGVPSDQIDKQLEKLDQYTKEPIKILVDSWKNLIGPVVIGLIVAAVIRTEKKTDESM